MGNWKIEFETGKLLSVGMGTQAVPNTGEMSGQQYGAYNLAMHQLNLFGSKLKITLYFQDSSSAKFILASNVKVGYQNVDIFKKVNPSWQQIVYAQHPKLKKKIAEPK